jgi:hypothetical protein
VDRGGSLWSAATPERRRPDATQLDKLHKLIATLANHGIYTELNLRVSKILTSADGMPATVAELPEGQKRVDMYSRMMIELQKDFARRVLTTRNPYTGKPPASDPAIAFICINNENSLLGCFTRDLGRGLNKLPEPFQSELDGLWNNWLARRYEKTADLAAAWAEDPENLADPKQVVDPSSQWITKVEPGSAGSVKQGPDSTSFSATVSKTSGVNWHVQVTTAGLKVKDNSVYTLRFDIRANTPCTINLCLANDNLLKPEEPWRTLGLQQLVPVSTNWTTVQMTFPTHSVAGDQAKLNFDISEKINLVEVRSLRFIPGAANGGLREGQSLEKHNVAVPTEPTTRQWADWINFLADTDRSFADEMFQYLRKTLRVHAPIVCSQINFNGLTALHRELNADYTDAHTYWEHPMINDGNWEGPNWTITNSPQIATLNDRRFGELGNLAQMRVVGKPFVVSEYDHSAPSDFVCEMYPSMAMFACRQDWDGIFVFDLGSFGARNKDSRISSFFDQINHPAKWSLAPFATRVFREALFTPATRIVELKPAKPVWSDGLHFDSLWTKLNPDAPFDFLNTRLQVQEQPGGDTGSLVTIGSSDSAPAQVLNARQGKVLAASADRAAFLTGFIGGDSTAAGPLNVSCPRFGRDFGTITAISLDGLSLPKSKRVLITVVARAENQGMKWDANRTTLRTNWGTGPTIAERIPASISLVSEVPRKIYALAPDGSRKREVPRRMVENALSFTVTPGDATLYYELVSEE